LSARQGFACTARLREKMPHVQVIRLTVYKNIKMIFQALKAGACGYVLKRSDEREILAAIAEVRAGGAPMTSEIARMVVRSFLEAAPISSSSDTDQLSTREMEIFALVAEGCPKALHQQRHRAHASDAHLRKTSCPLSHESDRQVSPGESLRGFNPIRH
jgi:DNA-binding NarL/FixJ family response regulator